MKKYSIAVGSGVFDVMTIPIGGTPDRVGFLGQLFFHMTREKNVKTYWNCLGEMVLMRAHSIICFNADI